MKKVSKNLIKGLVSISLAIGISGCGDTNKSDNSKSNNNGNKSTSTKITKSISILDSGATYIYEYKSTNVKSVTINDSEFKTCKLQLLQSTLHWNSGASFLAGKEDLFKVYNLSGNNTNSYGTRMSDDASYTVISNGKPIKLLLSFSQGSSAGFVKFKISCENK